MNTEQQYSTSVAHSHTKFSLTNLVSIHVKTKYLGKGPYNTIRNEYIFSSVGRGRVIFHLASETGKQTPATLYEPKSEYYWSFSVKSTELVESFMRRAEDNIFPIGEKVLVDFVSREIIHLSVTLLVCLT